MATSKIPYAQRKRIDYGFESYSIPSAADQATRYSTYTVTFNEPFSSPPRIVLTEQNSVSNVDNAFNVKAMLYQDPTASQFKFRVYTTSTSSRLGYIHWIAVGD